MDRRIYTKPEKSTQETESEVGILIGLATGILTQRHEHRNRNIHRQSQTQRQTHTHAEATTDSNTNAQST
jgi:hypothetical protein